MRQSVIIIIAQDPGGRMLFTCRLVFFCHSHLVAYVKDATKQYPSHSFLLTKVAPFNPHHPLEFHESQGKLLTSDGKAAASTVTTGRVITVDYSYSHPHPQYLNTFHMLHRAYNVCHPFLLGSLVHLPVFNQTETSHCG